jgi:hypothetical protein
MRPVAKIARERAQTDTAATSSRGYVTVCLEIPIAQAAAIPRAATRWATSSRRGWALRLTLQVSS